MAKRDREIGEVSDLVVLRETVDELAWLPLTRQQARWWRLDRLYGSTSCQRMVRLRFRGRLDHQALRGALGWLIGRHSILRTRVTGCDRAVRQYLASAEDADVLREQDVDGEWGAEQRYEREAVESLKINGGSLFRALLLRLPDHEYLLALALHPIVCDSTSVRRLVRELLMLYRAAVLGRDEVELPPVSRQYLDYALDEHIRERDSVCAREVERWERCFAAAAEPIGLRVSGLHDAPISNDRRRISVDIPPDVARLLIQQQNAQITVFVSVWVTVLMRCLGRRDILFGVQTSDTRALKERPLIGALQTMAPVYLRIGPGTTFERLVEEVSRSINSLEEATQDCEWESLLAMYPGERRCRPVMQLAISCGRRLGMDELRSIEIPALTIEEVLTDFQWPCAGISVMIEEGGMRPSMTVQYAASVIDSKEVHRVVECWRWLLQRTLSNGTMPIEGLEFPAGACVTNFCVQ